ncbi:MAG: PAS domain S-box protein [Balneolaceae bacterium]|nr:PAS domain S-box protein [Balneolaceae bacterium]
MIKPDLPKNEKERLQELHSYDILGESEQKDFDFLTRMAADICSAKISLISLVTEDKQWFLSHHGLEDRETHKDYSFCAHAINTPKEPFIVEDARKDDRFHDNPLVTGKPNVIFYAGIPLVNENDAALGSICVIDDAPRTISKEQLKSLRLLADQAIKLFELRRKNNQLAKKEKDLHKKDELLRVAQSINNIGVWELDLDTGKTSWSEEVYNIHEVDKDFDHDKANGIEFYHPEDRSRIAEAIENAIESGERFDVTARFITAKKKLKWVRSTGQIFQSGDGKTTLIGSFQDITELKESEQKFQGIFNSTFSFIGFLNPDGVLLDANDTALNMAGLTREDVIGKKFWDCYWWQISKKTQNELKENVQKAFQGEEVTYEVDVWIKDKKPITILFSLRPVFDERGMVNYIIPEGRPIQEVVDARNRYRAVIDGTQAGTYEWNIETNEVVINNRFAEMLGYTVEELEPVTFEKWLQNTHPKDLEKAQSLIKKCFKKEEDNFQLEMRLKHKSADWVWVNVRGRIFEWSPSGKAMKMYGTHQEITQRKRSEEALRVSEEAFRGNFENSAIGMALLDENGKWLEVNNRVCEIVGYSEEELRNLTFQDITYPEDLDLDLEYLNEIIRGKRDTYQMEKRYFHKDGHVINVILAVSVVKDSKNEILYFISQIIDITEKKETERKLHEALSSLQAILDASTQVTIIATDTEGTITHFNKGAELMLGYSAEEVVGKHTPQLIHLEDEIIQRGESLSEKLGREIRGFDVFTGEAKNGEAATSKWMYKRKDGSTYPILLSVTAISRENEIIGYLGVAADITPLEKAKEELDLLLNISQKQNERLKNFAHIVSHNLRTHSAGISGMLELVQMEHQEIFNNEYIQYLNIAAENLQETIEHLTEIVKKSFVEKDDFKPINLKKAIDRNKNSLITLANKNSVKIINEVNKSVNLNSIPAYLDSLIVNFLTNAIKYSDPQKDSFVSVYADTSDTDISLIAFEDNGLGIDLEKYGDKLFEMYHTFHKHEDSRGVGLFITKNQIESMGGYIEVESEAGKGTTFKVYLPNPRNRVLPE